MKMVHVFERQVLRILFLKIAGGDTLGFNNGEFLSLRGGLAREPEPFKGLLALRTSLSSRVVVSPPQKKGIELIILWVFCLPIAALALVLTVEF